MVSDSSPLVQSGMSLVERHVAEIARVLTTAGDLLIINVSDRGEPVRDRADMERLAHAFGPDVLLQPLGRIDVPSRQNR